MGRGREDSGNEKVSGWKRDLADGDDYGDHVDDDDDEDDDDDDGDVGSGTVNATTTNYINAFLAAQVRVSNLSVHL